MTKCWAPDFAKMNAEIDKMKPTETIVLQAFTRDINKIDVKTFYTKIDETVANAKKKAKKVVLPTIVYREDIEHAWRNYRPGKCIHVFHVWR